VNNPVLKFLKVLAGVVLGGGFLLTAGPARAQLTHLDDLPWFAPADSTSRLAMVAEFNRFEDGKYGWSTDRLHVCAIMPAGERSIFFVRMSHLLFDTGEVLPVDRWPWVRGLEEEYQWETEKTITSFGQPEIGSVGPLNLPGLKGSQYGVALGLPVGTDRLYPFASVSLPLRLAVRRHIDLWDQTRLNLKLGYLMNMESGQDLLNEEAFPSGLEFGAALDWYRGRGARSALTFDRRDLDGRKSTIVGLQSWFPWTDDGSLGLKIARELQGTLHGPAAWYFSLSWRFDSPGRRPAAEADAAADASGAAPGARL
jgi:hypothetical protein